MSESWKLIWNYWISKTDNSRIPSRGYRFSVAGTFRAAASSASASASASVETLSVVGRHLNTFNLSSAARMSSSCPPIYPLVAAEIRSSGPCGKPYALANFKADLHLRFAISVEKLKVVSDKIKFFDILNRSLTTGPHGKWAEVVAVHY